MEHGAEGQSGRQGTGSCAHVTRGQTEARVQTGGQDGNLGLGASLHFQRHRGFGEAVERDFGDGGEDRADARV